MSGDPFTRDLFAWLRQVVTDDGLCPIASRVAFIVSQNINRKTGEAWPTQMTIANELGASERGVRKGLDDLVDRGHLSVARGGIRARNRYRLVISDRNNRAGYQQPKPEHVCRSDEPQTGTVVPDCEIETGTPVPVSTVLNRHACSSETGTPVPPRPEHPFLHNHLIEPSEEPTELRDSLPARVLEVGPARSNNPPATTPPAYGFNVFWDAYPRKVAKPAASKAYQAAVKRGANPSSIVAGAQRYATERAGHDPKFTAHPTTWLNGDRWADDPPSPASGAGEANAFGNPDRGRPERQRSNLEIALAGLRMGDE